MRSSGRAGRTSASCTCWKDIRRRENMPYDAETGSYTCAGGKQITFDYDKKGQVKEWL
ncbi:MAG: hypothetical protein J5449_04785 [Oscillospiraceae bacterium]|nr:hypothetical protein [Oscillospiraceae bacterium]